MLLAILIGKTTDENIYIYGTIYKTIAKWCGPILNNLYQILTQKNYSMIIQGANIEGKYQMSFILPL